MRRLLPWLVACLSIVGCGDPNAGALFADIQYATECDVTRGCEPQPNRDICGINMSDPCAEVGGQAIVNCSITEAADRSTRTLTFGASQNTDFSIAVRQALFPYGGGFAGGAGCSVEVHDGPNTYVGACGAGAPTEMQPCQISNVRFYDDVGNPTVEGDIFCQMLPNRTNPTLEIELHAKGSDAMAVMSPGTFRLANCMGLEIPGS